MAAARSALGTRTTAGLARLFGLGGALWTLGGLALTLLLWALVPFGGTVPARLEGALTADAFLVLPVLLGAPVLLAAFVGSFVLAFGWYLVLTPSPLALIGVGGILYGVSGVMMLVSGTTRGSGGGAAQGRRS